MEMEPQRPAETHDARMVRLFVAAVAGEYGLPPAVLLGQGRTAEMAEARQVLYYLLMTDADLTCVAVARAVGRDHSTVLHGRAVVRQRRRAHPRLRETLTEVRRAFTRLNREEAEAAVAGTWRRDAVMAYLAYRRRRAVEVAYDRY